MVDQARVRSGFDVEIMVGEPALTNVLCTLLEAGVIPATVSDDDPPVDAVLREPLDIDRLYDPNPAVPVPGRGGFAFVTEILFDHPLGADVKVTVVVDLTDRTDGSTKDLVPLDLFLSLTLDTKTGDDGALASAGIQTGANRATPCGSRSRASSTRTWTFCLIPTSSSSSI